MRWHCAFCTSEEIAFRASHRRRLPQSHRAGRCWVGAVTAGKWGGSRESPAAELSLGRAGGSFHVGTRWSSACGRGVCLPGSLLCTSAKAI